MVVAFLSMIVMIFPVPVVVLTVVMITPMVIFLPAVLIMPAIASIVARFVFLRSDKIHGPIARIVFMTVLAPVSRMPRWYVQIDYRRRRSLTFNNHWLCVDERRRTFIADAYLTVNAGGNLPREYDVYIQSVSVADSDCCQQRSDERDSAHTHSPFKSKQPR